MGRIILTVIIVLLLLAALYFFIRRPGIQVSDGEEDTYTDGGRYAGRKKAYRRMGLWWIGIPLLVIGLIMLGATTITTVQAKTVGVPVTFGKPGEKTLDPGLHVKAPWTKVVKIDTTQQVDNYNGGKQDTDHSLIQINLGNGSPASAKVSITWQANGKVANEIYGSYRDDDPTELLYQRLVQNNIKQSVQNVLGDYDPLAAAKQAASSDTVTDANAISFSPPYEDLAGQIRSDFEAHIAKAGDFITVVDLKFSGLDYDKTTEKQITDLQAEFAKTAKATQAVKTADQQAKANKTLADSLAKTADGATTYCLSLIEQGKLNPPVGFSCFPGGGSNTILQPAAK